MAKSIENKVVSLELDDSKFTSRVDGVLKNTEKLKGGLNFKSATDGLDNISSAAQNSAKGVNALGGTIKNVNTTIQNGATTAASSTANVGAVAKQAETKFTILGNAAAVALGGIASKAVIAGSSILGSFTFGPIMDGFREYENQLNAVQTIQANTFSKGETVGTINAALDELNAYADRTIYSFSEMTKNIGMFTSAGVGLKESVASIKGLSNVAAMSGASSAQAATAMYQLSQALSTGVIKLQDWNSIVNAGMGGEQFQEALKRTARTYGVEVDAIIEKEGSFRNSLAKGWLTSEIMIETLAQYTGDLSKEQLLNAGYTEEQADQIMKLAETANDAATKVKTFSQLLDTVAESVGSGWASLFRTFFGDFERARDLWTNVSDVVNAGIGGFFDILQGILDRWDELGGWYDWWYGLGTLWTAISKPLAAIGTEVSKVLTGDAGKALADFSKFFHDNIASWLVMSDDMAVDLGKTFKMVAQIIWPALKALVGFGAAIGQVVIAAAKIGMILAGMFLKPLLLIGSKLSEIVDVFAKWFGEMFGGLDPLGALSKGLDTLVGWVQALADWWNHLLSVAITPFFNGIRFVIEAILPPIKEFFGVLKDALKSVFKPVGDALGGLSGSFKDFLNDSSSPFGKLTSVVTDWGINFSKTMDGVAKEIGPKWSEKVKKFSEAIKPISENIGKTLGGATKVATQALGNFWKNSKPGLLNAFHASIKMVSDAFKLLGSKISEAGDILGKYFAPQIEAVKIFGHVLQESFKKLSSGMSFKDSFSGLGDAFKTMMDSFGPVGQIINTIVDAFGKLGKVLSDLGGKIFGDTTNKGGALSKVFGGFGATVKSAFDSFGVLGGVLVSLTKIFTDLATAAGETLGKLVDWLTAGTSATKDFASQSTAFDGFKDNLGKAFGEVGKMIQQFWKGLGSSLKDLSLSDLLSGALLGGGLAMGFKTLQNLLGSVQSMTDSASGLMGKISGVFGELQKSLSALTETIKAKALRDISISIVILVAALFVLAMLPTDKVISGAVAIGVLAKILTTALDNLANIKVNTKKMTAIMGALFVLAGALMMLSLGVAVMGNMKLGTLVQGMAAIFLMTEGMAKIAEQLSSKEKQMISGIGSLIAMAVAINMLIAPVALLGLLPIPVLAQGLIAVGLLMAGMAAFVKMIDDQKSSFAQMAGTVLILNQLAGSLVILAGVVALLGAIPTKNLIQGLIGMAAVMAMMVITANTIQVSSLAGVFSLIIVAGAMLIATTAIATIALMPWKSFFKGVAMLGIVVAGLIFAAQLAEGASIGIMALALLAGVCVMLAGALSILGSLSLKQLAIALTALAGGLLVLIGAAAIAQAVVPGLIALTLAIAAIGAVVIGFVSSITILVMMLTAFISVVSLAGPAIGTGMVAIASGIAASAALIAAASPAIQAALIGIFNAIKNAAPAFGEAVLALVTALGPALIELIKWVGEAIKQLVASVIDILATEGPPLVEAILNFIIMLLTKIGEHLPEFMKQIVVILDALMDGLDAALPMLIEHIEAWVKNILDMLITMVPIFVTFAINLVIAIVQALTNEIPKLVQTGVDLITALLNGIASGAAAIIDAAFNALITFINGFSDAIDKRGPELKAAVWKLVNSIKNFLFSDISSIAGSVGGKAASVGTNIIQGIINGISRSANAIYQSMKNIATGALNAAKSALGIHSPSRKFAEIGKFMMLGLDKGLGDNEDMVYDDMKIISDKIIDAMDYNMDYEPVIKPTVDTSEIQNLKDLQLSGVQTSVVGASVQNGSQMQQELRALREELSNNKTQTVFNQYNTSPKALDLNDLYRQTERQLERMRRI